MNDYLLINKTFVICIISVCLLLMFWILLSDFRAKVNQMFFIMSMLIILWIFSYYQVIGSKDVPIALLWTKIAYSSVSLFFIFFYFFFINFFKIKRVNLWSSYLVIFIGLFFSIISLQTNYIAKDIVFQQQGVEIIFNKGSTYFYIAAILLVVFVLAQIFRNYFAFNKEEKIKLKFFLLGAIIWFGMNVTFNMIVPLIFKSVQLAPLGNYSAIIFLGFTAYAITKNQLFNIKVIATETTVVALSIGLMVDTFMSNGLTEGAIKGIVWVLATYGGYILIKSVKVEIKQKEELEVLAKKLDEANQHLEELDEAKDNFLSMAAHELNTPIAAIEGYLSMIVDEKMCGPLDKKLSDYLTNIYGSSKRLANLVKDLLNVSRIESNRIHLIYEETQVEDLVEQSISEVKIKADEVGHKLTFNKPDHTLPKTWLDQDRITEVIINMIGNAIKYTEPPGKIVVSAHADDKKIIISIEDNGRGIPKDKESHIFEKFVQVNVLKDQVKGTGLGMFISKNLIELHKGKIWFKSHTGEDHGTIFYFSLPILDKKPFDPNEGEGALFQTRQPHSPEKPVSPEQIAKLSEKGKPVEIK